MDTDDPAVVKAAAAFVRAQAKSAKTVDETFLAAMPEADQPTGDSKRGQTELLPEPGS